jgi:Icc-related predicted phosphoesterase
MNIAIFSDIHGRILLCFKLVERYQRETGEHIDLIIQCGDLGIFPDESRLDKATKRYAKIDGTELGFQRLFAKPHKEAEEVLSKVDCSMICVRGNHEDHTYLDELERKTEGALFSVDCYERIYLLKSGVPYNFRSGADQLDLLGIGRIGPPIGEPETSKEKYIQEYEKKRLADIDTNVNVDILLTHDSARDLVSEGFGMTEIRTFLDKNKPVYHFFGHTGQPFEKRMDSNGITVSAKMSDLEWRDSPRGQSLKVGCFGIVHWGNRIDHRFEPVQESWLNEYTPHTWMYL